MQDYSKMNPNDFTQKDLMLHLLQASQHTVTREELKEDISRLDTKFDKVESSLKEEISKVDEKISKVESSLKEDISKVDEKISKVESSLKEDISKVESSLREDILKVDEKISKVESSLKEDNKDLIKRMDRFIFWSLGITVTSTFLILGIMYKIIPK